MRVLAFTDILIKQELIEKGIKKAFPGAEIRFIAWPPSNGDLFSRENMTIEQNGPEAGMPVPGAVEAVQTFDPQVIIAQFAPVTREVIENAKSLEVIGCLRGGTENINVDAASKRKVLVFNNGGRTASAVAEFAIAHMLSVSRNIAQAHHAMMNGEWFRPQPPISEMFGCTVGLVGFGNVSQKLTERLQGFKVKVLTYDPYVPDEIIEKYGARRVGLNELLRESDFVSLHSRLTPETTNIIGEDEFQLMKPTAYLINTARAGLVDKTALVNALKTKQIRGAALDVFWQEPPAKDDPILQFTNVSLSPHIAGASDQTIWYTVWLFVESLQEFMKTKQSRGIVNFRPGEQLQIAAKMQMVKSAK
jgi:D-3-phosphoglycerate dehydrogenase